MLSEVVLPCSSFLTECFQLCSSSFYSFFQFVQPLKVHGFTRFSKKQISLPLLFLFIFPPVPSYISGRDPLVVVECCDAPRPMCQVSFSYSLLLSCHWLACCISPCHHVHCIIMFSKLAFVRVSQFSSLSVLSPDTLARARGMSEILFYKWPENVLGLG